LQPEGLLKPKQNPFAMKKQVMKWEAKRGEEKRLVNECFSL
jgi:hypothetical protein